MTQGAVEGLEKVVEAKGGVALAGVKMGKFIELMT